MNAGQLDRRIIIQEQQTSRDDWNHPRVQWATMATVWASKQDRTSVTVNELQQQVNVNRTVWTIRWRNDIDTTHRISAKGSYYYITGVKELGRQEGLQLITEERDNHE